MKYEGFTTFTTQHVARKTTVIRIPKLLIIQNRVNMAWFSLCGHTVFGIYQTAVIGSTKQHHKIYQVRWRYDGLGWSISHRTVTKSCAQISRLIDSVRLGSRVLFHEKARSRLLVRAGLMGVNVKLAYRTFLSPVLTTPSSMTCC